MYPRCLCLTRSVSPCFALAALPKHQGMSWRPGSSIPGQGLSPKQLRRCMCVASRDSSSSGGGSGGSSRSSSTCPTVAEYDALWEAPLGSITGETMRKFSRTFIAIGNILVQESSRSAPPRKGVIVETLLELLEESEWNLRMRMRAPTVPYIPCCWDCWCSPGSSPASAMSSYSFFSGTDLPKAPSRSRAPSYHEGSQTPSFSPTF